MPENVSYYQIFLRGFEGVLMVLLVAEGATNAYTAWFVEAAEFPDRIHDTETTRILDRCIGIYTALKTDAPIDREVERGSPCASISLS